MNDGECVWCMCVRKVWVGARQCCNWRLASVCESTVILWFLVGSLSRLVRVFWCYLSRWCGGVLGCVCGYWSCNQYVCARENELTGAEWFYPHKKHCSFHKLCSIYTWTDRISLCGLYIWSYSSVCKYKIDIILKKII